MAEKQKQLLQEINEYAAKIEKYEAEVQDLKEDLERVLLELADMVKSSN